MRLELLEQDVARDLEENIRHEEDDKSVVVFMTFQLKFGIHARNLGICDVDSASTCGQVMFFCSF